MGGTCTNIMLPWVWTAYCCLASILVVHKAHLYILLHGQGVLETTSNKRRSKLCPTLLTMARPLAQVCFCLADPSKRHYFILDYQPTKWVLGDPHPLTKICSAHLRFGHLSRHATMFQPRQQPAPLLPRASMVPKQPRNTNHWSRKMFIRTCVPDCSCTLLLWRSVFIVPYRAALLVVDSNWEMKRMGQKSCI